MDQRLKRKRLARSSPRPIVVIKSHSTGLETWHALIRFNHLPFTVDTIVHVDSHPDLMLPRIPLPPEQHELYEYLDSSTGGIAEWLTPALYRNHANSMYWLRAIWSNQLERGSSEFFIGPDAQTNLLKVTQNEAYFVDEDLTVPSAGELKDATRVRLHVVQSDDMPYALPQSWFLDVCLDFFACANPFYTLAVQSPLGRANSDFLMQAFSRASFRKLESARTRGPKSSMECSEKQQFQTLSERLWRQGFLSSTDVAELTQVLEPDLIEDYLQAGRAVHEAELFNLARGLLENCMVRLELRTR